MQHENPFETQMIEESSKTREVFREDIELKVAQDMKRCIAESLNKLDVAFDYFDGDCDNCDDDDWDDDYDFDDDDDELYEVTCPTCGDTILLDEGMIEEGSMNCPNCNELLEFDYDNLTIEDFEDSEDEEAAEKAEDKKDNK